jgi:predicted PurR-regulated permease PerM
MPLLNNRKVTVTFTDRTVVRIVIIVVLTFLGILFINKILSALVLIFLSLFLAVALNPAVSWISKHLRIKSRVRATGIAYLIVLSVITAFLVLVVPPLVRQTNDFAQALPDTIERYTDDDSAPMRFIREHNLEEDVQNGIQSLRNNVQDIGGQAVTTVNAVLAFVVSLVAVLVMTFMMLVEGPMWLKKFWDTQDPEKSERHKRVLSKMYKVVTGYVNGQLLIALIAGFFSLIVLMIVSTLLDVSVNVVVYALIITLTSLIPMFGATIGAIIVVALCAFVSWPLAGIMAIFFLIYQQVENATIQPGIQARQNELTPLLVFIAALIGIGFGGILGAFIAIPVAGCIRVWIVEYYGDRLSVNPKNIKHESKADPA